MPFDSLPVAPDPLTPATAALHADVVVVGGGLAGLTAAASAARGGARVTLLDGRRPGGRARSVVRSGYTLNDGGHALYRQAGGAAVLDALGVHVTGRSPRPAGYRTVWNGEVCRLPVTAPAILTSRLLGLRSKRIVARWFGDLAGTAAAAGDRPFGDWLDDAKAPVELRRWVLTLSRLSTYSATPERLPAEVVLRQLGGGGVRYLDGGWQTIVDRLTEVCSAAGVRIIRGEAVAIGPSDGRWSVSTPVADVSGAAIVLAVGPATAVRLLGGDPAGWVDRSGPVARAACLDIGGQRGTVEFLMSSDEPLYLSLHSDAARIAPPGRALYSVMRYLGHDERDVAADRRQLVAHAAAAGVTGEPDVERFLAAATVAWGSPQPGIVRPDGTELGGRGVFAAGDWIGPRLLADASLTTGAAAGIAAARFAARRSGGARMQHAG